MWKAAALVRPRWPARGALARGLRTSPLSPLDPRGSSASNALSGAAGRPRAAASSSPANANPKTPPSDQLAATFKKTGADAGTHAKLAEIPTRPATLTEAPAGRPEAPTTATKPEVPTSEVPKEAPGPGAPAEAPAKHSHGHAHKDTHAAGRRAAAAANPPPPASDGSGVVGWLLGGSALVALGYVGGALYAAGSDSFRETYTSAVPLGSAVYGVVGPIVGGPAAGAPKPTPTPAPTLPTTRAPAARDAGKAPSIGPGLTLVPKDVPTSAADSSTVAPAAEDAPPADSAAAAATATATVATTHAARADDADSASSTKSVVADPEAAASPARPAAHNDGNDREQEHSSPAGLEDAPSAESAAVSALAVPEGDSEPLPEPTTPAPLSSSPTEASPAPVAEEPTTAAADADVDPSLAAAPTPAAAPEPDSPAPVQASEPAAVEPNTAASEPTPPVQSTPAEELGNALAFLAAQLHHHTDPAVFEAHLQHARDAFSALEGQLTEALKDEVATAADHGREAAEAAAAAVAAREAELRQAWEQEKAALQTEITRVAEDTLAKRYQDLVATMNNQLAEQRHRLENALELRFKTTMGKERAERLAVLNKVSLQMKALEMLLRQQIAVTSANAALHRLVVALDATEDAVASRTPFQRELEALRVAAHESGLEITELALRSIPDSVAAEGVPSVADLRKRFATVRANVSRAAYVPPEGGMWANLLSAALSTVSVKPTGYVDGTDVEAILARTDYLLSHQDLEGATRELNQLTGWQRQLAHDWLVLARHNLEVRQALDVALSESSYALLTPIAPIRASPSPPS